MQARMETSLSLPRVQGVLFDLVGTTVHDSGLVGEALASAFAEDGLNVAPEEIARARGGEKRSIIRGILRRRDPGGVDERRVERIADRATACIARHLGRFREIRGATDLFHRLRFHGIRVGVGSGLPVTLFNELVSRLGWEGIVDYAGSWEALGLSRPDPKMIIHFGERTGLASVRRVLKVGDTPLDVAEGRNAGAFTVAVLTGSADRARLEEAEPDLIVESVSALGPLFVTALGFRLDLRRGV